VAYISHPTFFLSFIYRFFFSQANPNPIPRKHTQVGRHYGLSDDGISQAENRIGVEERSLFKPAY
jgi:hypothetical protein